MITYLAVLQLHCGALGVQSSFACLPVLCALPKIKALGLLKAAWSDCSWLWAKAIVLEMWDLLVGQLLLQCEASICQGMPPVMLRAASHV